MILRGTILDKATMQAVPGASVVIITSTGVYTGVGTSANSQGEFYLNTGTMSDGYFLEVSSVGYQTVKDMLYDDYMEDWSGKVLLQRMTKDLPPVVVTSGKKNLSWLLLLAIPFLIDDKKKSVGKIDNGTIITIGLGFVMLTGFGVLQQLLHSLGLGPSPGGNEQADPGSAWKPNYWISNASPERRQYLTNNFSLFFEATVNIYNALGFFSDAWSKVLAEFNKMQTKSDVSFLAWEFNQRYHGDLLTFLKTGKVDNISAPWDGLSDSHLEILLNYVKNLPKT